MNLSATVTAGYTLTPDLDGIYEINPAILQALGAPSVIIELGQNALVYASIDVSNEDSNTVTVTIQFKDANGANLNQRAVCHCWLSDVEAGAVTSDTFTGSGISATTGTLVSEYTDNVDFVAMSTTTGALVLTFEEDGAVANVLYFNLEVGGKHHNGNQAMTWTT